MSFPFQLKPTNPNNDLVNRGRAAYRQRQSILEPTHDGAFVAIEPNSGQYFLEKTATAALIAARTAMPDKLFYLPRVGRETAHTVRSYVKNPGLIGRL